jgi:hypothetical protein
MARQPDVPNLIAVLMVFSTRGGLVCRKDHTATAGRDRQGSVLGGIVVMPLTGDFCGARIMFA